MSPHAKLHEDAVRLAARMRDTARELRAETQHARQLVEEARELLRQGRVHVLPPLPDDPQR